MFLECFSSKYLCLLSVFLASICVSGKINNVKVQLNDPNSPLPGCFGEGGEALRPSSILSFVVVVTILGGGGGGGGGGAFKAHNISTI